MQLCSAKVQAPHGSNEQILAFSVNAVAFLASKFRIALLSLLPTQFAARAGA
jgi:hypothetical protein